MKDKYARKQIEEIKNDIKDFNRITKNLKHEVDCVKGFVDNPNNDKRADVEKLTKIVPALLEHLNLKIVEERGCPRCLDVKIVIKEK